MCSETGITFSGRGGAGKGVEVVIGDDGDLKKPRLNAAVPCFVVVDDGQQAGSQRRSEGETEGYTYNLNREKEQTRLPPIEEAL